MFDQYSEYTVRDGRVIPDSDVQYATGEGHAVGSIGYFYELNYLYRLERDMGGYRAKLNELLVKYEILPDSEPVTLKGTFFRDLSKIYRNPERGDELLKQLARAASALPPVDYDRTHQTPSTPSIEGSPGEDIF